MIRKLLVKTAFACMACDGSLDARELKCVRKFIDNENLYLVEELNIELDKLVDEFNLDGNAFMSQFFSDLHSADLAEEDQLKIIEYALAIFRADEIIDYREIKFFKIIRSLLPVSDEVIQANFENINEFLTRDILSDPLETISGKFFFSSVGKGNINLMHIVPEDK